MLNYTPYTPNEVIIDRAIELWVRAISDPHFKNGGLDFGNFMAGQLAGMLADKHKPTPEQIEKFRAELKWLLMNEVSLDQLQGKPETDNSHRYFHNSLSVDYHPDSILHAAAQRSGVSESLFPWKTSMSISREYVSFGNGYQAPRISHYPLSGGRWLIAQLQGQDMDKVIEYVEGGKPEFVVEEAQQIALPYLHEIV